MIELTAIRSRDPAAIVAVEAEHGSVDTPSAHCENEGLGRR
jgi:hypothetical protein